MNYCSAISSSLIPVARSAEESLSELQAHQLELERQNKELRRTQAALQQSHDRYMAFFDHAPVGYLILTEEGLISEANLTAVKLLGIERNKLLSRHFASLVTSNDSERWHLFYADIIKHNEPLNIDISLTDFNNIELSVQLDCLYVKSMLRITLTDITQLKQAEAIARISTEHIQTKKVQEQELSRLQKIASQLPGVVFQFRLRADGSACFPYASDAIRDIFRLSPEDVREDASKVFAILHPDDYDNIILSMQKAARNLSLWSQEYRVKFDDGTVRWLFGNARLQQDADGSTLWHGFINDITDRKQSDNNQRLSNIALKAISQGVLITDADQTILWANNAFESITGYALTEILNQNCRIIQGPLTDPQTIRKISLALKNFTPFSGEILNYRKDKTAFWNELTITPVFDEQGRLSNFISTTRDISQRKQLEAAFKQSHYELQSFIRQAPLSIAMFDLNMNYLTISDRWLMEFSPNTKDLIGRNHYEICPDLPAEWRLIHQQCLAGASLKNDDDLWLQQDGSKYWLRWAVSPWFDEKGAIGGIIITSENITERKQVEQALQAVENRLDFAIECSEIGAWDLDLIHETSWRSRGHDRIFGYELPPSEWNAAIAIRHVVPEDRERFNQSFETAYRTGNYFLECRIIQPDQTLRWINARGRVLYDDLAQPIRMLGTVVDVTEYKVAKEKEQEHLEKLAQVTRLGLMGEMASGIAHEVNQPLTAISIYAQVSMNLINTENPDWVKLNEVLFKTQQQALRAGRIIHRMKEFGQSHAARHLTVDINPLIYEAIDFCTTELKHHNITLNFDLADDLPAVVVDHIQIEQVIINLVRNSIEALQDLAQNLPRQLTITSLLTTQNNIQVSVIDNGPGINDDQKLKILTPFHTTKLNGTGMGLSISRSLIEAHTGTLYFNSELGKGSTFYFTLPVKTTDND